MAVTNIRIILITLQCLKCFQELKKKKKEGGHKKRKLMQSMLIIKLNHYNNYHIDNKRIFSLYKADNAMYSLALLLLQQYVSREMHLGCINGSIFRLYLCDKPVILNAAGPQGQKGITYNTNKRLNKSGQLCCCYVLSGKSDRFFSSPCHRPASG